MRNSEAESAKFIDDPRQSTNTMTILALDLAQNAGINFKRNFRVLSLVALSRAFHPFCLRYTCHAALQPTLGRLFGALACARSVPAALPPTLCLLIGALACARSIPKALLPV